MTTRNREQTLAFSEELSTLNCPGPFLFSEPGVVDHWCQSLPGGPILPLTPPDTDSEPDMSAKWSQTSLPEDSWFTGSAQDNSTYVQSSSSEWDTQTLLSSAQDFQSLDAFHWNHTSHGSVDAGLSPVLSHESQSSHTLNSFSEPELPSGLDLSFTFEPTWNPTGSMMCRDAPSMQRQLPGNAFVPSMDEMPLGNRMDDASTQWPLDFIGYTPQAVFYPQDGQTARLTARSPAVAAPRTLLPRTEGSLAATTPAFAQTSLHRQYQPSTQGGMSLRRSSQNVSTHGYAVHESPRTTSASYIAPRPATSGDAKMSSGFAMDHFQALPQSHGLPRTYTRDSFSAITDPAAEEFTAFIQYDQDEPSTVTGTSSHPTGTSSVQAMSATGSSQETTGPMNAKVEVDAKPIKVSPKSAAAPLAEMDEGRHRSHPLYAKGPDADGLFRCPFKAKESCPHNATKLKCNYDKFVDSHLKPFRCRQEACAKQEFSSTACLLRHEREAHGMHGHGDRPHLCFYTGCERGLPGNGFPRRYNLFDHMKRVHDHREDTSTGLPSPETTNADSAVHKKTAGRKRKAPSSTTSDPVMQKRKTTPRVVSQHTPVQGPLLPHQDVLQAPAQSDSHLYASGYQWPTASQNLQYTVPRTLELPMNDRYPQWTDQRAMATRNFDFVQSPEDLFDQNFQELRHG